MRLHDIPTTMQEERSCRKNNGPKIGGLDRQVYTGKGNTYPEDVASSSNNALRRPQPKDEKYVIFVRTVMQR